MTNTNRKINTHMSAIIYTQKICQMGKKKKSSASGFRINFLTEIWKCSMGIVFLLLFHARPYSFFLFIFLVLKESCAVETLTRCIDNCIQAKGQLKHFNLKKDAKARKLT